MELLQVNIAKAWNRTELETYF